MWSGTGTGWARETLVGQSLRFCALATPKVSGMREADPLTPRLWALIGRQRPDYTFVRTGFKSAVTPALGARFSSAALGEHEVMFAGAFGRHVRARACRLRRFGQAAGGVQLK